MPRSTRMLFLLLLISLSTLAWADNPAGLYQIQNYDLPIATADNLFSPLINPSLLGTGWSNGLGWAHLNDNEKWQDHYWFYANMDGLSYVLEHDNGVDYHTFATGSELFEQHIFPNIYAGTSYRWRNSNSGRGDFRSALTYRPLDAASLAFRLDNPHKASPSYRVGLGIRPLALISPANDYRLELTADIDYAKDAIGDYTIFKPSVGINTQVLDGIMLGASYNLETESAFLNFSLRSKTNELGTVVRMHEDDNYGLGYLHLGESSFKPFLGIQPQAWYNMNLKGNLVTYKAPKYSLGPISIFEGGQYSIEEMIEKLELAAADDAIQGIALINPSFSASFALQQELLTAFRNFKATGKKVAVYSDNLTNGGYIFSASVADKIYLNPMGSLDLRGIAVNSPYLHDLLDSIGVEVINFRSHAFKTAGNMFSESQMSPAEREMYESLLGSIYDQMIEQVSTGRGERLTGSLRDLIDQGPYYIAQNAVDAGLIDGIIYQDEFANTLKTEFGYNRMTAAPAEDVDYSWAQPRTQQIAVIYAQGNIVMGKGTPGQKIAHATIVEQIRAARRNPDYKGIILRVDSGGGSAQASDIILRELELAQSENHKPVVVSMAGVAGSGGYYIACGADRIVADPATLTGSIGVIGMAFNAERAFRKIRLNWSTVKMGERSDLGSMNRAWTDDERQIMTDVIEHTYHDFISKVDAGRESMDLDAVHHSAQGRVWTGAQALQIGLIDALGGMDVALQHMRELTRITGEIDLVDATTSDKGISITMKSNPLSAIMPIEELESLSADYLKIYELYRDYGDDNILMLSPLSLDQVQF